MDTLWLAFLTGLTTGGLSCLAVQGGLLASAVSQKGTLSNKAVVGTFLSAKIVAYTLLGFALGQIGSAVQISPQVQGWMQIAAGVFMLLTAARILDLHPIFRHFVIQPSKWAYMLVRGTSRDTSFYSPALLGFLTVLIPCGITQAMMILAVASSSPLAGAGIMFAFTLGTAPIFFALGITALEMLKRKTFALLAAGVIATLGVLSINTGQVLRGSFHTLQNYYKAVSINQPGIVEPGNLATMNGNGKQEVEIQVVDQGYISAVNTLKVGVPVVLKLKTENTYSCSRAFTIPFLNISKILPETGVVEVEFTPTKTGRLAYSCGMGMYTGSFTVVN